MENLKKEEQYQSNSSLFISTLINVHHKLKQDNDWRGNQGQCLYFNDTELLYNMYLFETLYSLTDFYLILNFFSIP